MVYRTLALLVACLALAAFVGAPSVAQEQGTKTHEGKFVKANGEKEFVMEDKGKEHSHTLAPGAKVIGSDGRDVKLSDLRNGQKIRVTTREGDLKVATKVEAMRPNP